MYKKPYNKDYPNSQGLLSIPIWEQPMPSWHGSICKMANYEEALKYADMALEQNDTLYDWISYYNSHKGSYYKEDSYPSLPSATGYDYVENYYFRCERVTQLCYQRT